MASKDRLQDRDLPFPWRNRDESGKAKARKAMDGILKAVTVFREMGSAVASLDPSHAGVAWAGVNVIMQVVNPYLPFFFGRCRRRLPMP